MIILYFMQYPLRYWIPVFVNLVVFITIVRLFRGRFTGEWAILNRQDIGFLIFGVSMLWPLTDAGFFVGGCFWIFGKLINILIKK